METRYSTQAPARGWARAKSSKGQILELREQAAWRIKGATLGRENERLSPRAPSAKPPRKSIVKCLSVIEADSSPPGCRRAGTLESTGRVAWL